MRKVINAMSMIILSIIITSPADVLVISAFTMFFSSWAAASASVTSWTLLWVSNVLTALLAALIVDIGSEASSPN